ncbi:MAG: DNA repair and recombination protein RadA [Candidatus Bathyarchaeota archaeon]|nr:MAG: DNA repair and recombination protein RadA [Candidatus Bathyarchaeota archaeon]
MDESVVDVGLENIKGVGPKTREKLVEGGIDSTLGLAVALPSEVKGILGGEEEKASKLILYARQHLEKQGLLEKEFITAREVFQKRKAMKRITTGSQNLDNLLLGGVETQGITEFFGDYGSGKTQICHTLCITCQLPPEQGGLGGGAIYIDTEGTFRPERLFQIAEAKELDPEEVLEKILLCKVYNSSHLELVIRGLSKFVEKYNAKLVIVDSVISLHRAEFIGRGTLANRQQRLNNLIHKLLRLAEIYNIAVVVTNQVQSKPDTFFGDPTRPAGGNVIAHACTYRIYLKKSGQYRSATIVDSPCHPYSTTRFQITENGIEDIST